VSPCHIKSAKFSHPTRPGDTVAIEFSAGAGTDIKFQCTVGDNIVLTGIVKCDPPATAP
jgi:3-hydroxyacyl-[acyl-carrier-protein] dehydratase